MSAWPDELPNQDQDPATLTYAPAPPGPDSISAADAEKTEALILCVCELMELYRVALLRVTRTGPDGRPSELDC